MAFKEEKRRNLARISLVEGLEEGGGLFIESPRALVVLGLPFHPKFIREKDSYQESSFRSIFFLYGLWASRFLGLVQGPNGSDVTSIVYD